MTVQSFPRIWLPGCDGILGSVRIWFICKFFLLGPIDCHRQFHAFCAALFNVPFVVQVMEMCFDCTRGYAQSLGDLGVFATLQEQLQDPVFTRSDLESVLGKRLCQRPFQFLWASGKLSDNEAGQTRLASVAFFDYIKRTKQFRSL